MSRADTGEARARRAKLHEIGAGTSEICRWPIACEIFEETA